MCFFTFIELIAFTLIAQGKRHNHSEITQSESERISCSVTSDTSQPQGLLGSSAHGISQASILDWDLPNPGIRPQSLTLQADSLTSEPPGKPYLKCVHSQMWDNF